jgi:hypothetical protein
MIIQPRFGGPASFPLRQYIPNNQTNVVMGMPMKPDTMTQGNAFSSNRQAFLRQAGGGQAYHDASEFTHLKTIVATGKSSTNPLGQVMSFAQPDKTTVKNAVRRCRAGGCVAPKKCGAKK